MPLAAVGMQRKNGSAGGTYTSSPPAGGASPQGEAKESFFPLFLLKKEAGLGAAPQIN